MSAFTTQIRFICESKAGLKESVGYDNIAQVIEGARPAIFDFPYPIFDDTYRAVLETKILKHYYTREIGEETYGLWKLRLDTKMNEIMPYYNQLYKSTLLEFNPLYDVDINRTHNATRKGTEILNGNVDTNGQVIASTNANNTTTSDNTTDQTSTNGNTDKYSATPQGGLDGLIQDKYLTNARMITGNDTLNSKAHTSTDNMIDSTTDTSTNMTTATKNNTTINNTEDYLESVKGKQGTQSYASMIIEFRETFLNIDMMVINDLSDLFMNIWTGGYPF